MGFEGLRAYHFRNFDDIQIDLAAPQVFLIGENGQGKTNFLEALYVLSYGSSFRTKKDSTLLHRGRDECALDATHNRDGVRDRLSYRYSKGTKRISVNDDAIRDRKDLIYTVLCVLFSHDDFSFISGAPEMQRLFFDQTLSLYDPVYLDQLRRYGRLLRSRNQALKDGLIDLVELYEVDLSRYGFDIQQFRAAATETFNHTFEETFSYISQLPETLRVEYRPSWKEAESAADAERHLAGHRDRDLVLRSTGSGIHRDRFVFRYGDVDFTTIASTGQIRLTSLVLRLAQARFFAGRLEKKPIFLLDDVLLELDLGRRKRFFEFMPELEQSIFTFLPDEPFEHYAQSDTLMYTVKDGHFERR